jgi:hypothetical protein
VTNTPSEPTNLVLEQLRLMRAEMSAMRADMVTRAEANARFDRLESDIADIKKDLREIQTLYDRPDLKSLSGNRGPIRHCELAPATGRP